jgi:hypothetical protein
MVRTERNPRALWPNIRLPLANVRPVHRGGSVVMTVRNNSGWSQSKSRSGVDGVVEVVGITTGFAVDERCAQLWTKIVGRASRRGDLRERWRWAVYRNNLGQTQDRGRHGR